MLIEKVKKYWVDITLVFCPCGHFWSSVVYLFSPPVNFQPSGFLFIRLSGFGLTVQLEKFDIVLTLSQQTGYLEFSLLN